MECRAKQMYEAHPAGSQAMAKYFPQRKAQEEADLEACRIY